MSDREARPPLSFASAQGLPKEQAAFFYLGPSQVVTEGVIFFPYPGNAAVFVCDQRLFVVDTAAHWFTARLLEDLRQNHSGAPVDTIVYTHGHIDHAFGTTAFLDDAAKRGFPRPRIIAHEDLPRRFDRYQLLAEQNNFINRIQFSLPEDARPFTGLPYVYPDTVYRDALETEVGGERFELYHSRGETDDETWVWCPRRRVLCTGDTFVWCSPNAGNPFKVQRYALDWARALEQMAALRPLHLLAGHGPVLSGQERIQEALLDTARWLRTIHDQVVQKMNEGKWLEDIVREMVYPADLARKPWLRPIYDHPEFVVRNVYRLYGGWYDGDPANILPAHTEDIARELIAAAGSAPILARARRLRQEGQLQLACHLVDWVRKGEPANREAWELWRDLFAERAAQEESLMARGAFHSAIREAEARLAELDKKAP